ncbi:MAG TPA: hypothetical protein PLR18_02260 [bacterium]|nr:hypothetical protein [bacterium]
MDEQKKNEAMQTIFLGPAGASELSHQRKETKKIKPLVWWLVAGGVLIILAVLWLGTGRDDKKDDNQDQWQAVFLDNGQVYFGHMVESDQWEVTLVDVYYPQKPVPLQQGTEALQQSDFAIVKFGGEIYGTEDKMNINRQAILFRADLKEESKIMQAIKKHKEKK